jgi:Na+-driven multidrug efflux pump
MVNVPGMSVSTAVMILCGQRMGSGRRDDIKKTVGTGILVSSVLMAVFCAAVILLIPVLMNVYNTDADTERILRTLIYVTVITTPLFWSFSFVLPAGLRAAGDTRFTMLVSATSMWVFRIGTGYLFSIALGMGVFGIWLAMYTDWVVRGAVFLAKLFSGKWGRREVI